MMTTSSLFVSDT